MKDLTAAKSAFGAANSSLTLNAETYRAKHITQRLGKGEKGSTLGFIQ
jgi:hypothetical protein